MPSSRSRAARATAHPGDDLKLISGIGPAAARRLESAGIRTYKDIVASTPEELGAILAGVAGHSAVRIAASDWIGQARRLDVVAAVPDRPELDPPPLIRVSRLTSARPRSSDRAATPDEPTTVGLELIPDPDAVRAPTLDYSAAIVARRLDGDGEFPIAEVRGVVHVGRGVSLAAAGPPLPPGLYRLVATVKAHATGHATSEPPAWSQAVLGGLLQVAAPPTRAGRGTDEPGAQARERLLADGAISESEFAALEATAPLNV
jgi:Helix-hairpin-helix domain